MTELWKDIPDYEGKYYVSNFGRIKNNSGLIMKPMKCTNGYLAACLWKQNNQKKILIHRLVALLFLDNPFNYDEINHKDENKENNHISNLEWCTHLYNMNYGDVKRKISRANKGKQISEEHKRICALSALGKKWMHNETKEVLVKEEDIPSFLLSGFNLGRYKNV